MTKSRKIRFSCAALGAALLALALNGCGRAASEDELQIDSNTNWLMRCDSDDQCSGSLRCYCGQCSQPCAQTDECGLLSGAECSASISSCTGQPSGGLCVLGCQADAECGSDFTCDAGQCVPRPCQVSAQSMDDLLKTIAFDLATLDADVALFTRYLSTANHRDLGSCGAQLTAERQGASKLLNSLSTEPTLTAPTEVDAAQTLLRIDLRDYGWDQPVSVAGVTYPDVWESLTTHNPFAVQFLGEDADDASTDTQTTIPFMFVNSFIATATRPDLYYAILGIPPTIDELFADLGVSRSSPDMLAGDTASAAGVFDVVSSHWQTQTRTGYVWEFAATDRPAVSLLTTPLVAPSGEGELIFSLPNGLQAFATIASNGDRSESSATFLDPAEEDFLFKAPRSFLRAFSPKFSLQDDVRAYVQANPAAFAPDEAAEILRLYAGPEALAALLDSEYQSLTRPALEAAQVDVRRGEPISVTFSNYARDVELAQAAGELMITTEELRDNLLVLDPALSTLNGGAVDRDDFAAYFRSSLCILSIVNENQPSTEYCP